MRNNRWDFASAVAVAASMAACGSNGDRGAMVDAGSVDATDALAVPQLPENPLDANAGPALTCPLACPPDAPSEGSSCGIPGQLCAYGSDLRWECREAHRCVAGKWRTEAPPSACASPEPMLPCPTTKPAQREACSHGGLKCQFGTQDCTCDQSTAEWRCGAHDPWCGDREPNPGQRCAEGQLCSYFEGYPCQVVWECRCGVWDVHVTSCQ